MLEAQPPLRPNTLCSTITKAGSWSWTNAMLTCVLDYVREGGEFELKHWWLAALSVNEFEEGEGSGRILEAEVHLETIWRWKDRSEAQLLAIKDRNTLPKEGRQNSLAIKVLWTIKREQLFSSLDDFLMYKRHALSMQEPVQLLCGGIFWWNVHFGLREVKLVNPLQFHSQFALFPMHPSLFHSQRLYCWANCSRLTVSHCTSQ